MLELDRWRRASPLAVLFFFGRGIKALAGNYAQLAGTIGFLANLARESIWIALLGGVALLALLAVVAVLSFWRFRFKLEADRVLVRQGVFRHRELAVQFGRIQGVHQEQSVLFRLLGLATVSFDTAGSAQREGHLPAVPAAFATALRDRIETARGGAARFAGQGPADRPPLLRLGSGDLVRVGLTDPSVLTGLLLLPLLAQNDGLREWATATVQRLATAVEGHVAAAAAIAVAAALALLLGATVASAFLRFHNFELRLEGAAFRARGGLLTRKETVLERGKIQQFVLRQSLPLRAFRRYRLRALPASSGQARDSGGQMLPGAALTVPLADAAVAARLRDKMLGGESGDGRALGLLPGDRFAPVSAHWLRPPLLTLAALPAVAGVPLLVLAFGPPGLLGLAWPPAVAGLAWLAWRRRGYAYSAEALAVRSGILGCKIETCLFRKAQAVAVHRTPLQRRKGLATLEIQLASGAAIVPFIPHRSACALRDMLLYKAEASSLPWH